MRKRLSLLLVIAAALVIVAPAQVADSNPARTPTVFLGNNRPKNPKDKKPVDRSVKGKVVDQSGQPLGGALVTITDLKTNDKWTFITKNDGRYSFAGLSFTVDYELQARYHDWTSEPRKLSQYDHAPNTVRILPVGPGSNSSAETKQQPPK